MSTSVSRVQEELSLHTMHPSFFRKKIMADGWATFGKGVFLVLAVGGGIWVGRGGQVPELASLVPQGVIAPQNAQNTYPHTFYAPPGAPADGYSGGGYGQAQNPPQYYPGMPHPLPAEIAAQPVWASRNAELPPPPSIALQQPVQQVSAAATIPAFVVMTMAEAPKPTEITSIVADGVECKSGDNVRIRRGRTFDFAVAHPSDDAVDVKIIRLNSDNTNSDQVFTAKMNPSAKRWAFELPKNWPLQFQAKFDIADIRGESVPIDFTFDDPTNTASALSASNNILVAAQAVDPTKPTEAPFGFLRIVGNTNQKGAVSLSLDQFVEGSGAYRALPDAIATTQPDRDGNWSIDLKLTSLSLAKSQGQIVAWTVDGSGARSYSQPVKYIIPTDAKPSITLSKVGTELVTPAGLKTNITPITIEWKDATPYAQAGFNSQVVLFDNGSRVTEPVPVGAATGSIQIELTQEGLHRLELAIVVGDKIVKSAPFEVDYRTRGPVPLGAEFLPSSSTPGSAVIRVRFNPQSPLDPKSLDSGQFSITREHPLTTEGKNVGATLTFVEGQNAVDLKIPNGAEPDGYTLEIVHTEAGSKKILDTYGNSLGATSANKVGESFRLQLFKLADQENTLPQRGLSGSTGPSVEYPEYTKFRELEVGFNPSDKVVTRIARLYYFRDAHRVVQLLNREATSYRRAAVDQAAQLVDKTRRVTDKSTDDRRLAEIKASRAAAQARAAESAVVQAQATLTQAQTDRGQANETYQRVLSDITKQEAAVTNAKANVDKNQSQLDSLKNQTPPAPAVNIDSAQAALTSSQANLSAEQSKLDSLRNNRDALARQRTDAEARIANSTRMMNTALSEVQSSRNSEVTETDEAVRLAAAEERNQKVLFQQEVAAATADPDTYAPGKPDSIDPILQVSYSVIGEGEIQLRGPLKGVNLARTLINQIDAPTGQVRVSVHTVQINGERGERMEPVAERIQRYVDHSRFLTMQSAQMLRHAVTTVAAQRAEMVLAECEGASQHDRDLKYLYAFFGRQFIDELLEMDSEFLRTDNKLLSLHSMDSTSLAQALFLLGLAKNDVRMEILAEFERLTTCELPQQEIEFFETSGAKWKFGPALHKQKFQFLGQNSRFVSLRGQFNVQVNHPDTITPLQREFIRLAQIFKSRLIAEREIQQRVMERGLIEERFGNYTEKLREALANETSAEVRLRDSAAKKEASRRDLQQITITTTTQFRTIVDSTRKALEAANSIRDPSDEIRLSLSQLVAILDENELFYNDGELARYKRDGFIKPIFVPVISNAEETVSITIYNEPINLSFGARLGTGQRKSRDGNATKTDVVLPEYGFKSQEDLDRFMRIVAPIASRISIANAVLDDVNLDPALSKMRDGVISNIAKVNARLSSNEPDPIVILNNLYTAARNLQTILGIVQPRAEGFSSAMEKLVFNVQDSDTSVQDFANVWFSLRNEILNFSAGSFRGQLDQQFRSFDSKLSDFLIDILVNELAQQAAVRDRRPLDHKKFMDMLVDDAEDRYIEILEGTRAQTANIDNYLGRIITALDDDMNTQFYNPTFKHIREAGRYWDVQMGQIETTTVLTNNRTFARVAPQAMMEFDLPKRDILINEAFESAAAAYQDYGALLEDPTFLSLTKMYGSRPTSSTFGGMPTPLVRSVLPSLPSETNEKLMIQEGAISPDFPSALESLIPDPAIYKFETGTAFDIRPVIQPDGQAVKFHLNYLYTTNLREPVRADEKHLGRVKRHFVDTDVQLGNFEMREVSRYTVALKASRTSRGVPGLEDVPVAGVLFRPLPQQQSSLQQNLILSQATIFPTLFDLMGLRWAPAVASLTTGSLREADFVTQGRRKDLESRVFDYSSSQVDDFLRIAPADRRPDLYRPQTPIPRDRPDGTTSRGLNLEEGIMIEEGAMSPDVERQQEGVLQEESSSRLVIPPPIALPVIPSGAGSQGTGSMKVPQLLPQSKAGNGRAQLKRDTDTSGVLVPVAEMVPGKSPTSAMVRSHSSPISTTTYHPQEHSPEARLFVLSRIEDQGLNLTSDSNEANLLDDPVLQPVTLAKEMIPPQSSKEGGIRRWFKSKFLPRSADSKP